MCIRDRSYTYSLTGDGVDVVIQDSGLQVDHPEFTDGSGTTRVQQIDWGTVSGLFTQNANHYRDYHGHGTHCAGIIAAVRNNKMAKTKPIYFDLNQDAIRPDAAIELTKVVDLMNKYPSMKIEIKSHTDSRAPDNYNLDLTNKRAESSINYIISKGIDSKRISGRGYGETELLNKCSNGVKCTDAEHEQNRRMEFIVIEE